MRWRRVRGFLSIILIGTCIFGSYIYKEKNTQVISDYTNIPIYSVNKDEKVASLTFDINWGERDYLNDILEVLNKYNVKATFFIMGGWVNYSVDNLEKLKAIDKAGHEIGNHSYIHPSFTSISSDRMQQELKKTDDTLEAAIGKKTKLFRFPSGDYNAQAVKFVKSAGYIPIQWDVDSVDWREQGADIEYSRITKKIKPGSIILFHNNAKFTPENLEKLIGSYTKEGYKFIPVGELIYMENDSVDKNGIQFRK